MQGITESTARASPTNSHFNYTKLLSVFSEYANSANCMDGKSFVKLAKDTGLLDRKLTTTEVDIVFAKVKAKFERKITFDQFMHGLELLAEKKRVEPKVVRDKVSASKGPILNGTRTLSVKLHDDKSCYTGIYARGGPKIKDKPREINLDGDLCDRNNSTIDGRKKPTKNH